ncbi:hypothetical protein [Photobacterium piscicola]|uniref:Uncharacterized protein n=1 Tax=Photobacterium piscicola TaxID=1378299 RepID=A0ABU6LD14_9GAMM|nr:hypothetical protein [Photobacterium piscicola]
MLFYRGELRKVINFKSKAGNDLYKIKVELSHFDVEIFIPKKYYDQIEKFENNISKTLDFPIYFNCQISDDKTKVYKNYCLADLPKFQ